VSWGRRRVGRTGIGVKRLRWSFIIIKQRAFVMASEEKRLGRLTDQTCALFAVFVQDQCEPLQEEDAASGPELGDQRIQNVDKGPGIDFADHGLV
jgi:hypothetical protein